MKKTVSKPNALKVFNDNKAAAYKKAGGAMKDFKKSLKKAQDGMSFNNTYSGPLTESDSKRLDKEFPSTAAPKIPYAQNKPRMGYGDENMYRQKEKSIPVALILEHDYLYKRIPKYNYWPTLLKVRMDPDYTIYSNNTDFMLSIPVKFSKNLQNSKLFSS
jgi:hypothetical protein